MKQFFENIIILLFLVLLIPWVIANKFADNMAAIKRDLDRMYGR